LLKKADLSLQDRDDISQIFKENGLINGEPIAQADNPKQINGAENLMVSNEHLNLFDDSSIIDPTIQK